MERITRRRLLGSVGAVGAAGALGAWMLARSSGRGGAMGDISMGGGGALGPELASIERGNFAAI
jgi:hypothetical protein